jgi:RimJ/RimL family protein N-acetyltransferase
LLLRPPLADDAEVIAALANSATVARDLVGMPHPYRVDHARAWLAEPVDPRGQRHLVCLKGVDAAPVAIGVITLDIRSAKQPGWISCWLGERHWGHGFATEACHAAIDYGFLHQRHDKMLFASRVTNAGGRRVIEKCGFQMVAQELAWAVGNGAAVAIDRFQIDRRTWASIRAWEPLHVHHRDADSVERHGRSGELTALEG